MIINKAEKNYQNSKNFISLLKEIFIFKKILGTSPFLRLENDNGVYLSDEAFFEIMTKTMDSENKFRRLNNI